MKGRWRADKRKPGCGISCAQPSSRCALQDEKTPQADIFKGFTFSKSESSTTRTDALQGAHSALVRSQFIMSDGISHDDFMKALTGGSICIPSFFSMQESQNIFQSLMQELNEYKCNLSQSEKDDYEHGVSGGDLNLQSTQGVEPWSRHLKHENPQEFPTFRKVIKRLSDYFDVEVYATRLNIYPDGSHWKPQHHDSHAYSSEKTEREDFTVGASFGATRSLEFVHVRSGISFLFVQKSGDIFGFNSTVNKSFTHGVPEETCGHVGPRLSIILWGRRRSLNERNACAGECDKLGTA